MTHLNDGGVYVAGERQHDGHCHDDSEGRQTDGDNGEDVVKPHVLLWQPAGVDRRTEDIALLTARCVSTGGSLTRGVHEGSYGECVSMPI